MNVHEAEKDDTVVDPEAPVMIVVVGAKGIDTVDAVTVQVGRETRVSP